MKSPSRVLVSHPTGNTFVRALLDELENQNSLEFFYTSIGVGQKPASIIHTFIKRRSYSIPDKKISRLWFAEAKRLLFHRVSSQERKRLLTDHSYEALDTKVAKNLHRHPIKTIHAYEDGAYRSFLRAKELGVRCSYELPIAHWSTVRRLLTEEAERRPDWEPTLESTRESEEKLVRKDKEIEAADFIICPSDFVLRSIPEETQCRKPCQVAHFGSPSPVSKKEFPVDHPGKQNLRVLFVGSMSQRKGLADLFDAIKLVNSPKVSLTIVGQPSMPLTFYRSKYPSFNHIESCCNSEISAIMRSHDLLILPSIVEGRALVQQEALANGLPIIVTRNAGGEDLVDEGKTGFLVPIREPHIIAERIEWFLSHLKNFPEFRNLCKIKAGHYSWSNYAKKVMENFKDEIQI